MISAYCTTNFPNKPGQSSITYTQSLNNSGQVATIRCNTGFVFAGTPASIEVTPPTTTTTTVSTSTLPPLSMDKIRL